MAAEKFSNNGTTTTSGSINNSSDPVTLTVTSATNFPSSGNFRILIDNEILLVTSVSGTSFTASRAQEGTSIASHSSGAIVALVLTAGSLSRAIQDANISSAFGSRSTSDRYNGRLFFPTDSFQFSRDTGSVWESWGPLDKWTKPSGSYSWDNQGSASIDTTDDGQLLIKPDYNSGNPTVRYKTAPSAPYTVDIRFEFNYNPTATHAGFLFGWRENSSGKLHILQTSVGNNNFGGVRMENKKFTNSTTFSADYQTFSETSTSLTDIYPWIRLIDDNTNRKIQISNDGVSWAQLHSVGRTDFLTADQLVFGLIKLTNNGNQVSLKIHSWREF